VVAAFGLADFRPQVEQAVRVQSSVLADYNMRAFDRDLDGRQTAPADASVQSSGLLGRSDVGVSPGAAFYDQLFPLCLDWANDGYAVVHVDRTKVRGPEHGGIKFRDFG
jgi:hypothetical protein